MAIVVSVVEAAVAVVIVKVDTGGERIGIRRVVWELVGSIQSSAVASGVVVVRHQLRLKGTGLEMSPGPTIRACLRVSRRLVIGSLSHSPAQQCMAERERPKRR